MGTRSLIHIKDGDVVIATIYRQFDGYPSGLGQELANFLKSRTLINGISKGQTSKTHANGMGCLAAQLVTHLKGDGIGNVYLDSPGRKPVWEEYVYTIEAKDKGFTMKCHQVLAENTTKLLYSGAPSKFNGEAVEGLE